MYKIAHSTNCGAAQIYDLARSTHIRATQIYDLVDAHDSVRGSTGVRHRSRNSSTVNDFLSASQIADVARAV